MAGFNVKLRNQNNPFRGRFGEKTLARALQAWKVRPIFHTSVFFSPSFGGRTSRFFNRLFQKMATRITTAVSNSAPRMKTPPCPGPLFGGAGTGGTNDSPHDGHCTLSPGKTPPAGKT